MTKVTLDPFFNKLTQMARELGAVPLEMAEETGDDEVKEMERQPKSGSPFNRGFKRHSAAGERPAVDSETLKNSKSVKRTGPQSAKVGFEADYLGKLIDRKRKVLPESDVPKLEKKQKEKVEKVLDKYL